MSSEHIEFVSIPTAAAEADCHAITIKRKIWRGEIAAYNWNNRLCLRRDDWEALKAALPLISELPTRRRGRK
jgi:hypothetical protein